MLSSSPGPQQDPIKSNELLIRSASSEEINFHENDKGFYTPGVQDYFHNPDYCKELLRDGVKVFKDGVEQALDKDGDIVNKEDGIIITRDQDEIVIERSPEEDITINRENQAGPKRVDLEMGPKRVNLEMGPKTVNLELGPKTVNLDLSKETEETSAPDDAIWVANDSWVQFAQNKEGKWVWRLRTKIEYPQPRPPDIRSGEENEVIMELNCGSDKQNAKNRGPNLCIAMIVKLKSLGRIYGDNNKLDAALAQGFGVVHHGGGTFMIYEHVQRDFMQNGHDLLHGRFRYIGGSRENSSLNGYDNSSLRHEGLPSEEKFLGLRNTLLSDSGISPELKGEIKKATNGVLLRDLLRRERDKAAGADKDAIEKHRYEISSFAAEGDLVDLRNELLKDSQIGEDVKEKIKGARTAKGMMDICDTADPNILGVNHRERNESLMGSMRQLGKMGGEAANQNDEPMNIIMPKFVPFEGEPDRKGSRLSLEFGRLGHRSKDWTVANGFLSLFGDKRAPYMSRMVDHINLCLGEMEEKEKKDGGTSAVVDERQSLQNEAEKRRVEDQMTMNMEKIEEGGARMDMERIENGNSSIDNT